MSRLAGIVARNRAGAPAGIASWCTAHPETLTAILQCYRDDEAPILIEATCNQVNQFGGYTGMTPVQFREMVSRLAMAERIDPARLILGGDHLGPNPWKAESAMQAMEKARRMVADYVAAGFRKIHLDASMRCADDVNLSDADMADRAADLAVVAEASGGNVDYVIGTEVPVPGGEMQRLDTLAITTPDAVRRTVELHRRAFAARGLDAAFARVVGVVVQPGVDFGNDQVFDFDPANACDLAAAVPGLGGPVFEAHSTDYQSADALAGLVAGHFAILKVGPELTFAFRQAAFALDRLAGESGLGGGLVETLVEAMKHDPDDWRAHVETGPRERAMMLYGLSDRARYYWARPPVQKAQQALFSSLRAAPVAPGLLAQITGGLVGAVPQDVPRAVIGAMVGAVVAKYRSATGEG